VVGLGLMVYAGKYSTLHPRDETYNAYLESLAVFAGWLLEHDYDIRLLLGDADTDVIEEFRSVLARQVGAYDHDRIVEQPITSVHDVLAGLAATDIVVATRFHNVLLSLLLNKPVIAITFHHKCSSLMREMTLSEYCHDIDEMNADRLIAQFKELEGNSESVKHAIEQAVDGARTDVENQYEHLFASA
jgi:polysaccharide pyruvyl transferase WcaK-like protein